MNKRSIVFSLITVLIISSANGMPIRSEQTNSSNTDDSGYAITTKTIKKGLFIAAGAAAAGYCIYSWIAHRDAQIAKWTGRLIDKGYTKECAAYIAKTFNGSRIRELMLLVSKGFAIDEALQYCRTLSSSDLSALMFAVKNGMQKEWISGYMNAKNGKYIADGLNKLGQQINNAAFTASMNAKK